MRCQKCGFISFDQPSCSKCGADQTGKSSYSGTGQKTDPPFFLAAALGDAVAGAAPSVTETSAAVAAQEARDGSADLFDALEAESQGIIITEEEPQELDLSFDQPEEEEAAVEEAEEISLVIPEQEAPPPAEEPETQPAAPAPEEESLELSLEIPEQDEDVAAAPEEAQEITLEIQAEEPPAAQEDSAEEAETTRQEPESLDLPEKSPSTVDLQEIDLSDLVADTDAAPAKAGDNDEIFDLSSLMDAPDTEQDHDTFTLTMDVSDTPPTEREETKPASKKSDTLSGLTLESEE